MSLSNQNSTVTPLVASDYFYGVSEQVEKYGSVSITVYTDVDSMPDGLTLWWSNDNTHWEISDTDTIVGGTAYWKAFSVKAKYYRVEYHNNTTIQAEMRLYSMFHNEGNHDVNIGEPVEVLQATSPWIVSQSTNILGTHGNLWNTVAVVDGSLSNAIDISSVGKISIFGNTDAANNIEVWVSQDNVNYYQSSITIFGNGDFYLQIPFSAKWVQLKSRAISTITATVSGKC